MKATFLNTACMRELESGTIVNQLKTHSFYSIFTIFGVFLVVFKNFKN